MKRDVLAEHRDNERPREETEGFPAFEPPMARTFRSEEIRAEIGPAQMCSPSPCPLSP